VEIKELFEGWLSEHFPDRKEHVLSLIRDARGGQLYDARWGVRMRGPDPTPTCWSGGSRRPARASGSTSMATSCAPICSGYPRRPGTSSACSDRCSVCLRCVIDGAAAFEDRLMANAMNTRRTLLAGGGGVLAVAAGGLAVRAFQTGVIGDSGEPRRLWREWTRLPPPMSVVAAGVLAASPHNSQPWQFQIDDQVIGLELDPRRDLGPVDPFRRQMWIGAGCAVENMVSGGEALGRPVTVTPLPDPASPTAAARLEIGLPIRFHPGRGC
jgi:hypothetical protein